jgi:hypothetical protein
VANEILANQNQIDNIVKNDEKDDAIIFFLIHLKGFLPSGSLKLIFSLKLKSEKNSET